MEGNWKQRLAALTAWQDEVTRTLAALQAQNTVNTDAVGHIFFTRCLHWSVSVMERRAQIVREMVLFKLVP